jgi:tetratricopeptide (TPR) repeat protein
VNRQARFVPLVGLICLLLGSAGVARGTTLDPTDPVGLYQSAVEAMQQGLWMEALSGFETLCEHPEAEASLKESAWIYRIRLILETQPDQVEPLVVAYSEAFPHGAMARQLYETVGHYYWDSNRPEKAREYFTKAKQSRVDQAALARVLYWEAETALEAGDIDQSLTSFLALTQRTPEQPQAPEAYYSAGRLYLENQAYDKSAETFEQLREAHPFHPTTRRIGTALGESYYQERQFEQAAQAFLDALPFIEGEAEHKAVYLAAESYKALQRYDEAVTTCRLLI